MNRLSIDRLRELFQVCSKSPSGVASLEPRKRGPHATPGTPVITGRCPRGYFLGSYTDGKALPDRSNVYPLLAHRVVFALVHGYWPEEVDHIDRNKSNNHPSNLREVTRRQNLWNTGKRSSNTSGYLGVQYKPKVSVKNPWVARVGQKHVGCFPTAEAAGAAAAAARARLYGEFAPADQ